MLFIAGAAVEPQGLFSPPPKTLLRHESSRRAIFWNELSFSLMKMVEKANTYEKFLVTEVGYHHHTTNAKRLKILFYCQPQSSMLFFPSCRETCGNFNLSCGTIAASVSFSYPYTLILIDENEPKSYNMWILSVGEVGNPVLSSQSPFFLPTSIFYASQIRYFDIFPMQ